jgi:hypothetical protein
MGIVVAGLVLLLGIRFVGQQLENQDKILYSKFVNGVSGSVESTSFRSVDQVEYNLPPKYVAVCFVDYDVGKERFKSADNDNSLFIYKTYPAIYDEIDIRVDPVFSSPEIVEKNTDMFLIDSKGAVSAESVGKVMEFPDFPQHYSCIDIVDGYVKLEFEGVKGGVKVSEWQ